MLRKKRFTILYVFLLAIAPLISYGTPDFPDGGEEPPGEVPLDGGASLLVAAGIAYGYKKHKQRVSARDHQQ